MNQGAKSPAAPNLKATGIPEKPGWYVVGLRAWRGQPPPRQAVTFGGISFPLYAYDENPTVKSDSIQYDQRRRGQRVYLDEYELKALKKACGKKIVRVRSQKTGKCAIISASSREAQRPLNGDLPLERFLTIEPAEPPGSEKPEGDAHLAPPIG